MVKPSQEDESILHGYEFFFEILVPIHMPKHF